MKIIIKHKFIKFKKKIRSKIYEIKKKFKKNKEILFN